MDELEEELEALRAILMNNVEITVSNDGVSTNVRADLKLNGCKVTVEFQGNNKDDLACCC